MKRAIFALLALATLAGCATTGAKPQDPAIVAGDSLLAAKQTIVTIRRQVAVPCQQGIIPQADCQQVGDIYLMSKDAYDAAADAAVLALSSATPENQANAQAKEQALISLAGEATALALKYGVKGGP